MKSFFQYFKDAFVYIGALASIAGFLIILFQEATSTIILIAFCVFLLILLIKVFLTANKFLGLKSKDGYENISSMLKYSTPDGKHIEFNHYKVIQAKKLIFTEYANTNGTERIRLRLVHLYKKS